MSRSLLFLAAGALVLTGCDSAGDADTQRVNEAELAEAEAPAPPPLPGQIVRFKAGTQLPALTFEDPAGNSIDLASLKGTPVLLNLWATWCAPCVVEMPMLDNLANEMQGKIKVLTVSQDVRGAEVVEPFFASREFRNLEPWLDQQADLAAEFTDGGLMPVTILFDAEGRELFRVAGGYEWDSEEAIAAITEAIES